MTWNCTLTSLIVEHLYHMRSYWLPNHGLCCSFDQTKQPSPCHRVKVCRCYANAGYIGDLHARIDLFFYCVNEMYRFKCP